MLASACEIVGLSERRKILVSLDDVTDAKAKAEALAAAKEEAERANLGKSRFLAAASHDLRQPLQTMSLLQGMLAEEVSGPAASKLIKRLDTTVVAMSGLLDKILDINQLEAGVVEPKLCDFAIDDLLRQLHGEFEIHALNEGLELRVAPCSLTVHSDPRLLEQIPPQHDLQRHEIYEPRQGSARLPAAREPIEHRSLGHRHGNPGNRTQRDLQRVSSTGQPSGQAREGLGLGLAIVQRLGDLLEAPISVRSRVGRARPSRWMCLWSARRCPFPRFLKARAPQKRMGSLVRFQGGRAILIVEDDAEIRIRSNCFSKPAAFARWPPAMEIKPLPLPPLAAWVSI